MPLALDQALPRVEEAAIVVDGRADEAAWAEAMVVEEWVSYYPVPDGEPLAHATTRIVADAEGLYLYWEVVDPEPDKVRARLTRRDNFWGDDFVGIYLDPAADAQRGYLFMVNPLGVQADATLVAGGQDQFSWDGIWSSAGRMTDTGFVVEMAIPWSSVRHPAEMQQVGISLLRGTARIGQRSGWPRRDPAVNGILNQEVLLRGPGPVDQSRNLRVIPELAWAWTEGAPREGSLTFGGLKPGITARYEPVPALALVGTVNPDFSQVESDTAQIDVNRRYALYYEERRQFFQDGSEWFGGAYEDLLYTRSFVEPLYGARGTLEAGDWRVAALNVMDAKPSASTSELGGWSEEEIGENAAMGTIVRARRSVGVDGYLGLVASDKRVLGAPLSNQVIGVDTRVRLGDATSVRGALMGSATASGEGGVKLAPAMSFAFDRSDANLSTGAWVDARHADFRAENGFLTMGDYLSTGAWASWTSYPARGPFTSLTLTALDPHATWTLSTSQPRSIGNYSGVELGVMGSSWVSFGVATGGEDYLGTWLPSERGELFVHSQALERAWVTVGVSGGEDSYYPGSSSEKLGSLSGSLTLLPAPWARAVGSATVESMPGFYRAEIYRLRAEAFASPQLSTRVVLQEVRTELPGAPLEVSRRLDLLLAWQKGPGQAVFVGGSATGGETLAWQGFAKASWVFGA